MSPWPDNPSPQIIVVEDDVVQADYLDQLVKQHWPRYRVRFFRYESEFAEAFEAGECAGCVAFLIDCRLPWAAGQESRPDAPEHSAYRAGIRCIALLRRSRQFPAVPVAIRTHVDQRYIIPELQQFQGAVACFGKEYDEEQRLIRYLDACLKTAPPAV